MKVRLYSGSLRLVEKSGVGQAIHHQRAMLESAGIPVTLRDEPDADIVQINTVFPDSFAAAVFARLREQKVIYYGHSTMEDFRNSFKCSNLLAPLFKRWIKLCYSMGDAVITPTEYSRQILLSYGIRKPIYALSNGVDTDFFCFCPEYRDAFRRSYHLGEREKAVISVGHYIERKGLLDFIALARTMPSVRFFWFGYTDLRLVPDVIRRAIESAPANVTFPGYVGREALREAYCGCDLFCFMSYEETEGIVVLEALSCGTPALLRDIPVYRGWLKDGENVYFAEDIPSFRRRAAELLHRWMPDLTENGRAAARQRSIPRVAAQLAAICGGLLEEDKGKTGRCAGGGGTA